VANGGRRCPHGASQVQRQHRVCVSAEFQDIAEYVLAPRALALQLTAADTFAKHQVDKPIRVESLVKCKMQDNLEFLQFVKQYWDQHFPGHDYDPVSRRKGQGGLPATGGAAPRAAPAAARRAPAASNTAAPRTRTPLAAGGGGAASAALREENTQLKETVSGLERERDFYFSKLRDIELLIQQAMEADPELEKDEGLLKQIQNILYSTEEGFEIPPEAEGAEEETF
jgi:RP/EB family microtubule-associated protein